MTARGLLVAMTIVAGTAGCASEPHEPAVAAAPPRADTPVGPIPGLAEADLSGATNPFAEDLRALDQGRRFFVWYNCAGCHGDHGGGGMGPSLRDNAWLYGGSHAQVADSIAEGRANGMPAWGQMLTEAQIWQITAYVKSLRTSHEPQPPGS
jgi:cytochrome c oxidase cbb3-type subunit 3